MSNSTGTTGNVSTPSNTKNTTSMVDKLRKYGQSNIGLIIVAFVLVCVIIYVIIYIYKTYNSTSLKTATMLKKPLKITNTEIVNVSNNVALPELYNGKEFSYSFWIYVDAVHPNNDYKFVLGRLNAKEDYSSGNPIFFLDKSLNKLYVYVRTEGDQTSSLSTMVNSSNTLNIRYLPLQRWVNILLVVDNNFVQLFLDGDLRQVKDLSGNSAQPANKVVATSSGNLMAGGSESSIAFDGYLSKVQALNYAATIDHAKVIYKAGPLHKSILAAIGVPFYGIQSPFYRIDEQTEVTGGNSSK